MVEKIQIIRKVTNMPFNQYIFNDFSHNFPLSFYFSQRDLSLSLSLSLSNFKPQSSAAMAKLKLSGILSLSLSLDFKPNPTSLQLSAFFFLLVFSKESFHGRNPFFGF
jgi:hypothetical protein